MRSRKAERYARKGRPYDQNNLRHEASPLMQAFDDFKAGIPGAGQRINELLGCQKRPGRKRPLIGEQPDEQEE